MLKHILASGDHARHLIKAIAHCCHDDIVHIFSGTLRLWLDYITKQVGTDSMYYAGKHAADRGTRPGIFNEVLLPIDANDSLYDREKSRLFHVTPNGDAALYSMLKFSRVVAHHQLCCLSWHAQGRHIDSGSYCICQCGLQFVWSAWRAGTEYLWTEARCIGSVHVYLAYFSGHDQCAGIDSCIADTKALILTGMARQVV